MLNNKWYWKEEFKMKKQVVYILFFIGFIGFAQQNLVTVTADTTSIKIGEQIQFKILVNETNNVIFPKLKLDSLGKVEVVETLPTDTLKNSLEKKYLLTSFDSGRYVIPQQEILISNKKYVTDSLLIKVATVKVDTTKQGLYEIKSIKSEPKTFDDYKHLWWILIPVLLLIAGILYVIFRKKKEKIIPKVHVAPIQEAMQRLVELDGKKLLQQNKIKIYYSELTDIVRTYIEKDIKIPALESTTNELIETITDFNESSKLGISKETIQQLKQVLQSADLVKFAKSKPIVEEIKNDRTTIEQILKDTEGAVHKKRVQEAEVTQDQAVEIVVEKPKKKNNFKKYLLIFAAFFIIVIGVAGYFGYKFLKKNVLGDTTLEMMDSNKQWYKATYGHPPITIETPEVLKIESVQLPDNGVTSIGDFSSYSYKSLISNFYVIVSTIHFLSEVDNFNLDGGVQGSIKSMEAKMNTTFTNIQQEPILIDGNEGRKVLMDYTLENPITKKMENNKLTMLLFANTKGMQQVFVSYPEKEASAKQVSERIINSVSINN